MDVYIGTIMPATFDFVPRGWEMCNGESISIEHFKQLFELIGTTYGGDGKSHFNLPDLRNRVLIHKGAGPGLTPRVLGEKGGDTQVSISKDNIPATSQFIKLMPGDLEVLGPVQHNTEPVSIMQPFIVVNYIIATSGIYPY
jgi:microcystin-dependent protein